MQAPAVHTWSPLTLEHINVESEAGDPKTFNTKRELKDFCKKHKLQSGALL